MTNFLFHESDFGIPADWNCFATSHGKGENDGVGGDVKNAVWRKTLQLKVIITNLKEFVEVAKAKFPSFVIEQCSTNDVRAKEDFLNARYRKHSKDLAGIMAWHYVEVKDKKIKSDLLSPCPCHADASTVGPIDTNIDMEIEDSDNNSVIKPVEGQFYRVKYTFQSKKKNEVTKVLPAMCEKNDIEEHYFVFLKHVESKRIYLYT